MNQENQQIFAQVVSWIPGILLIIFIIVMGKHDSEQREQRNKRDK